MQVKDAPRPVRDPSWARLVVIGLAFGTCSDGLSSAHYIGPHIHPSRISHPNRIWGPPRPRLPQLLHLTRRSTMKVSSAWLCILALVLAQTNASLGVNGGQQEIVKTRTSTETEVQMELNGVASLNPRQRDQTQFSLPGPHASRPQQSRIATFLDAVNQRSTPIVSVLLSAGLFARIYDVDYLCGVALILCALLWFIVEERTH